MLRYFLIIVLTITVSACGGGGKKNSSTGESPTPPDTTKKYRLGGAAKGLKGNLVIANAGDTLTLDKDGEFIFGKTVNEGSLYDVKIVSLPKDQLCELRNSKNYIYREQRNIGIECATLVERKASLSVPARYKLSDLRVVSNYQAKGGSGEDPLTELSTNMMVFANSVVSLRNADNKIIFLSYLTDSSAEDFELNSKSTATALMLLEPTVVSAINYKTALLNEALIGYKTTVPAPKAEDVAKYSDKIQAGLNKLGTSSLVNVVNAKGDLDLLAAEIDKLVNNGDNLTTPTAALSSSLSRVLDSAVRTISAVQIPSTTSQTKPAVVKQKYSEANSSEALGVTFQYFKATDGSGSFDLFAINQSPRYVLLSSNRFSDALVVPYGQAEFELKSGPSSQNNFNVLITGPGVLGEISSASEAGVIKSTIASGLNQYFLPSVNATLGLNIPGDFNIGDCLAGDTIKNLGGNTLQANIRDDVLQDKYYKAFTKISYSARAQFVNGANSQSPISELFACEKFGLGVLITSKKSIAIDNVGAVLLALNNIFSPDNFLANVSLNLYNLPQVSPLAEAIRNSYAERTWVLSTALQFNILANKTQILIGDSVQFTSTCKDPATSAAVACSVDWDFGDGNKASGISATNKYIKDGHYTVTAKAKDADGAEQTQTLSVDVMSFSQNETAYGNWTVKHGSSETAFNSMRSTTIYDDNESNMQIRLYATLNQENPQLRLLLSGYNFNSNSRGDGIYSLDDSSSGETCLGFYGDDAATSDNLYCTSTLGLTRSHPFTGSVTVTADSATGGKKGVFEFDAYNTACVGDISSCDFIHVSGEVKFKPGL